MYAINSILLEDFAVIEKSETNWEMLREKSIFVTGGTGFLGSLILKYLDFLNNKWKLNMILYTLVRDKQKAEKMFKGCQVVMLQGDLCTAVDFPEKMDFIIHCAAVTESKQMVEKPVEVAQGIVSGTDRILDFARRSEIKSMVYLSSMEVYGQTDPNLERVTETDLGYLDSLKSRSCYPLGKRMAENLCYDYYSQYKVPVRIARLAQVFGPGVLPGEGRVFMQFARAAMQKQDIILHTFGNSMGNYCYTADALSGLFKLLFHGQSGEAYNVVNERNSMTIREMADIVAREIAKAEIEVRIEIPEENIYGYPPPTGMRLSSAKLEQLGWKAEYGLEEMYGRMISYLEEMEC